MKRTQLNLDEKTYYQLASYAKHERKSLSEAARNLISKQLQTTETSTLGSLLKLVEIGKKSSKNLPSDLSENHDYYLYGEGSPKFSSKNK